MLSDVPLSGGHELIHNPFLWIRKEVKGGTEAFGWKEASLRPAVNEL